MERCYEDKFYDHGDLMERGKNNHFFQGFEENQNQRMINFSYFNNLKELIVYMKEAIVIRAII